MKYKKYISTPFLAILLLPLLNAKPVTFVVDEVDVNSINFIKETQQIELDFDTNKYLPQNFNPYQEVIPVNEINFMEEENIDLGFDTSKFLPEDFNPYKNIVPQF